MNEQTRRQLMIVVERAVRPVRTTVKQKRRMREELLGHLIAIFEDEAERCRDGQIALDLARRRFGDPAELTRELQQTVPWWDRFGCYVDKQRHEPGESPWHLAVKYVVVTLVMCGAMAFPLVLALVWKGRSSEIILGLQVLLALGIYSGTFGFMGAYLPNQIGRALYGSQRERSLRAAAQYALVSMLAFVVAFFLMYLAMPGGFGVVAGYFGLACCFAPLVPVLFGAMGRRMADESRYEEEWASLETDQ